MHEINPRLYLGSISSAANRSALAEEGITHVLSVCLSAKDVGHRQRIRIPPSGDEPCTRLVVAIEDKASARLDKHFDACSNFISEGLREGAILVHCQAGQSRSATVVIAYLMREERWPLETALRFVQKKRPSVHPNIGFLDQLRALQTKLGIQDDDGFENVAESDKPAVVLEVSDNIREENCTHESVGEMSTVAVEANVSTLDVHVEIPDLFDAVDTRFRLERMRSRLARLKNPSGLLGVRKSSRRYR
jgi:predicted protein tyrosine phosphatase